MQCKAGAGSKSEQFQKRNHVVLTLLHCISYIQSTFLDNEAMAPYNSTAIVFKDFVNDGKVPESNFVVEQQKVPWLCTNIMGGKYMQVAAGLAVAVADALCSQLRRVLHALVVRPELEGSPQTHVAKETLLFWDGLNPLQVDPDALKDGEVLVSCNIGLRADVT